MRYEECIELGRFIMAETGYQFGFEVVQNEKSLEVPVDEPFNSDPAWYELYADVGGRGIDVDIAEVALLDGVSVSIDSMTDRGYRVEFNWDGRSVDDAFSYRGRIGKMDYPGIVTGTVRFGGRGFSLDGDPDSGVVTFSAAVSGTIHRVVVEFSETGKTVHGVPIVECSYSVYRDGEYLDSVSFSEEFVCDIPVMEMVDSWVPVGEESIPKMHVDRTIKAV